MAGQSELTLSVTDPGSVESILAEAIYREGLKVVTAGANSMAVKRGIDKAVDASVAELSEERDAVRELGLI